MFYLLITSHFLFLPTYGVMNFVINQTQKATFDQAERYCLEEGYAGLAVLDTPEKMNEVKNSGEIHKNKNYWVALYQWDRKNPRNATYAWKTGTTWARWKYKSEPNYLHKDHCCRYWGSKNLIANKHCSDNEYHFICEKSYDHVNITGNYPIIHKNNTLWNQTSELMLFSGTTRSEMECVTICARSLICGFVVYSRTSRACSTYLKKLKEITIHENLKEETGTNIREKLLIQ